MRKTYAARISAIIMTAAIALCSCETAREPDAPKKSEYTSRPGMATTSSESHEGQKEDLTATMSFAGDILVHTPLFKSAKTGDGYDFIRFFGEMENFFDSDLNLVNVETPIDALGDNSSISTYPAFNAPREITNLLEYMGVNTVSFVNNHVYDKKYSGFKRTVGLLHEKFDVVGAYLSEEEYRKPQIFDVNGIRVGMLAYTDHVNGYSSDRLEKYSLRTFKLTDEYADSIIEDVGRLKEAGAEFTVVSLHWGSEYRDAPSDAQKKFARKLTDGGVDIILGGHSHCVQPIEKRKITDADGSEREALIIYSIGNFLADQTGLQSRRGASYIKTQQGMKVTVSLKKDKNTGKVTLDGASYTPTMLFRKKLGTDKYTYKLLAIKQYAERDSSKRPEIFFSDTDWQNCKKAYTRIVGIVGNDITVE